MGVKAVLAVIGDSLQAGYNGPATQTPLFGANGDSRTYIYNRYTFDAGVGNEADTVAVRTGTSDTGHTPGWDSIRYADSNWQNTGPLPVYYTANAIRRYLGLEELRVIFMAIPATDVTQTPPNGNNSISWYPGLSNGIMGRYQTKYIDEALATPEVTSQHIYLGCIASLGNNLNNSTVYTTDESGSLSSNLSSVFSAVEGSLLASGGGRQVVTRLSYSVIAEEPNVSQSRLETSQAQVASWKQTANRASARLDGIPWNSSDPHFSDSSAMLLGTKMFKAWISAQTRTETFNTVDVS
jgi:hypothetical protein